MTRVLEILTSSYEVFMTMAPFLLLGFTLAGVLYVLVPRSWVTRHLGGRGWLAVLKGAVVGIPLPLCSCGTIPFATSLQKQGAGRGPTTAFLIATPQTGVDSILVTYSFLGLPFALYRVVAALVTGAVGGLLAAAMDRGEATRRFEAEATASPQRSCLDKVKAALRFGLVETVEDVAGWLVVGVLIAGALDAVLPAESLSPERLGGTLVSMLAVLVVALPMYVCATASVPIAAALVLKGMPLGAALVFLVAGPATNAATLSVFTKALGKRTVAAYVGTLVVLSLALGWLFELLLGNISLVQSGMHHHDGLTPVSLAAGALLGALLVRALVAGLQNRLATARETEPPAEGPRLELAVTGMNCDNCRRHVQASLEGAAPGATVRVDLDAGRAEVWGQSASPEALIAAVGKAGYGAELVG